MPRFGLECVPRVTGRPRRPLESEMVAPLSQPHRRPKPPELHLVGEADELLLHRIAGGDQSAFEALYRRYARPVFGMALRRLRDHGRAEDAVQDTFNAIWRGADTYRPQRGSAARWLWTVARNAISDHGRAAARSSPQYLVAAVPEVASCDPRPDQAVEDEWLVFRTHAAVSGLPEPERVVLELAYWRGQSQSEIARGLELPLGTVKTRTRKGLARLADRIDRES